MSIPSSRAAVSILSQPYWPLLRPYVRIEAHGSGGRFRIEIDPPHPKASYEWQALTMPCVVCGATVHPVRSRSKWKTCYFAATCPAEVNPSCGRSKAATAEYRKVREAVEREG